MNESGQCCNLRLRFSSRDAEISSETQCSVCEAAVCLCFFTEGMYFVKTLLKPHNGIFLPIVAFTPYFVSVFNIECNYLMLLSLNYILECPVNASLSLFWLDLLEKILPKIIHFRLDMYSKVKHGLNLDFYF